MNISLQIGRGIFALGLMAVAGAGAFAQSDGDADAQAPAVAHKRLEILSAAADKEAPRRVVASVKVGTPQQPPASGEPVAVAVHAQAMPAPRG